MTDDMVERTARALFAEMTRGTDWRGINGTGTWDNDTSETAKETWRRTVRAVIEAMREPTAAMVDAAYDREREIFGPHPHANMNISTAWGIMIDAALKTPAKQI